MGRMLRLFVGLWVFCAIVSGNVEGQRVKDDLNPVDEWSTIAQLSSYDVEHEEGYFALGEGISVILNDASQKRPREDVIELYRWLLSHRGQKVRLTFEAVKDNTISRYETKR